MDGPPYIPKNALPGLQPTVQQDAAACGVLIAIYLASAIAHQVIFQTNRKRGHKFPMSWAMFGLGMARVGTLVLRLAWATRPNNASLAIAAIVFTNAGVLIIYVVALLLTLRTFRALHPRLGWKPALNHDVQAAYFALAIAIILVISFAVTSFYTLDSQLLTAALWVQRAGTLVLLLFNLIAPVLYILCLVLPASPDAENFGSGSMRAKLVIVGWTLFFTVFIAGFRTGIAWSPGAPATSPPWYDSRAAFYTIELGFEIIITYTLLLTQYHKRFWIPNRSERPGDYSLISVNDSGDLKRCMAVQMRLGKSDAGAPQV